MKTLTREQLAKIYPLAGARIDTYLPHINATLQEFRIDTTARIAAFLAQVGHESMQLLYVCELANGHAYDERFDLGNCTADARRIAREKGVGVGEFWKGHGLIQITGFYNHAACALFFGLKPEDAPHWLMQPEGATRSAGWFWLTHGCNALADASDFVGLTRRINGGINGLANRTALHIGALAALSGPQQDDGDAHELA